MKRLYTAFCDNGHDRFYYDYWSEYRNNSKKNKEDAERQKKRGGHKGRIVSTSLSEYF